MTYNNGFDESKSVKSIKDNLPDIFLIGSASPFGFSYVDNSLYWRLLKVWTDLLLFKFFNFASYLNKVNLYLKKLKYNNNVQYM